MGAHVRTLGKRRWQVVLTEVQCGILTQGKPITMEDMKGTPGVNRIHGQIIIITITIIAYITVPTT